MATLFVAFSQTFISHATDIVTYAGGAGNESFNDLIQISDGTYLVCGGTDDLDWIDTEKSHLKCIDRIAGLENSNGTGRYAFILRISNDLSRIIDGVYLPKGAAEEFNFMKTTNIPGEETGNIYVSGNIKHTGIFSNNQRPVTVFIARLDKNFINGLPSSFVWQHSFWSEGYVADYHPWDVGSNGKVIMAEGQSHAADYGAIYMLDADTGEYCVVPRWRNHRYTFHRLMNDSKQRDDFIEGDFWGYPEDHKPNLTQVEAYERDTEFNIVKDSTGNPIVTERGDSISNILYSRIYTKWNGSADLRSWTQEDFDLWQEDENGSYKKGKYPWDMIFASPCNPDNIGGSTDQNKEGYTRYRTQGGAKAVYGTSSITVDRRTNDFYIGMNVSSKLPDGGLPDFEPVVIAYRSDGEMKWWSRLYHETVNGKASYNNGVLNVINYQTNTSTPDQYIDGIAIDYSCGENDGNIIVNARAHGNNVENLWEGNTIAANPGASGFKNGFSGKSGDKHLGWIGRMRTDNGQLLASTYVAEPTDDAEFGGSVLSDPNLDGWHNPNDGWLELNTTRIVNNTMKVSANGYPVIIASGRRTITTANANQKMYKPEEGKSSWNTFVRVYNQDLSLPKYSSLATGVFDVDGVGGDNIVLKNVWKTRNGVIAVGYSKVSSQGVPEGNDINLGNVPSWGKENREGTDAVLFAFEADNIKNLLDGYDDKEVIHRYEDDDAGIGDISEGGGIDKCIINDTDILVVSDSTYPVKILNGNGLVIKNTQTNTSVDITSLQAGMYIVVWKNNSRKFIK